MADERENVIECYKTFFEALVNKDTEKLDVLLSEGFQHIHMTGMKQFKAQYISGIVNGIQNYRFVEHDSIEAEVINNFAEVRGKSRAQVAAFGGEYHEWDLEQTFKMSFRDGIWCIDEMAVTPNF